MKNILWRHSTKCNYHREITCKTEVTLANPRRKICWSLVYKYMYLSWKLLLQIFFNLHQLHIHPNKLKFNFFYSGILSYKMYIHTTQPTNLRPMPTNFYGLVRYDRVKNYPLWFNSVSIPDQHTLYPRCIPDAPTLKSRSPRPTPVFRAYQSPLCTTNLRPIPDTTTLNIEPTPDLYAWFPLPASNE